LKEAASLEGEAVRVFVSGRINQGVRILSRQFRKLNGS
jgi:hypothetical protein